MTASGRSRLTRAQRTWQDLAKQAKGKKPSKWKNKRTKFDGLTFDSQAEAREWQKLKVLSGRGVIQNLKRQVNYPLELNGVLVTTYRSDFEWDEWKAAGNRAWEEHVVADKKGALTPEYKIKRALMKAIHGIEIREL